MSLPLQSGRVIRFGLFEIELETGELRKEGLLIKLQGRPFEILCILVEQPGRVVSREEFRQRLWPADTFVDFDHSLNVSINKLRQALGDSAENPRFVATAGRRGYRFIAPTEQLHMVLPVTALPETKVVPEPVSRRRRWVPFFAVATGLALVAAVLIGFSRFNPSPQVKRTIQLTYSGTVFRSQLLTDGPRVYFREGVEGGETLRQMSVAGGDTSTIPGIGPNLNMQDLSLRTSDLLLVDRDETRASLRVASLVSSSVRRLGEMKASSAAWSPDGSRLAYTNGLEVYVASGDGADLHKLVTLPQEAYCLRWSPDGTRLRFVEDDPKPQQSSLWEIGSDGHGLRSVLPQWSESWRESCGNWSTDGRYFFFESTREGTRDIWAIRERTRWAGSKPSEPIRLTSGPLNFFSPTPSRESNQLFVVGEQRRGELTRYDERHRQFEPFLGGVSANDLQFSPDGMWVVYTSYPDRRLWRSKADGSQKLQLSTSSMRAFLPAWSPDGERILFQGIAKPNQPWKIYLTSPAGSAPEMLISDPDSQETGGSWLPDGHSVGYAYNKLSASPDSLEIRVLDLSTKHISTLPASQMVYAPAWSPDGRYVLGLAQKDYLVLFDTATQKWTTLLPLGVGYPSWSRDGQYIYCNTLWRKNPALIRVAVKTGKMEAFPVNFVAAGTFGAWSGMTPDGSFLLLRDRGSRDIYSLDLNLP